MTKITKKEKWAIRNAQEVAILLRNRSDLSFAEKDALAKLCNVADDYIDNAEIIPE